MKLAATLLLSVALCAAAVSSLASTDAPVLKAPKPRLQTESEPLTPPTQIEMIASLKRDVSQVVTQRIGYYHDLGGVKGFNLDIRGFGGFNITQGAAPTAGLLAAFSVPIKNGPTFNVGPQFQLTQKNRPEWGIYVGITFNFSKD